MKKSFLHLVPIQNPTDHNNLSYLKDYYNDVLTLKKDINTLLEPSQFVNQLQGKKVLIKPNWVKHSSNATDEVCLRTNDNFVLAVLGIVLEQNPGEVIVGDAPLQGCRWDKMISRAFQVEVNNLSKKHGIPVHIKDFRRRNYIISENSPISELRPLTDYVIFDLGEKSLLEAVTKPGKTSFRVNNYDPDRMSFAHTRGIHKYCIVKDFFTSDFIISLPKIKTHQKSGITGALKNLVGINGDKDFLPHHRIGGKEFGGDCYPGMSYLRYWSELLIDKANRNQGTKYFWPWQKLSSLLWTLSFPGPEHNMDAGWYGNDTTWRMVMDLNKIAEFGRIEGTISDFPQRQIFSICDGIIGGQGEGPLSPQPLPLGIISFTNNSLINDKAMAILMSFPPGRIPLLNSGNIAEYGDDCEITFSRDKVKLEDLEQYAITTKPPKGWINYFNNKYETSHSPYQRLI